MVNLADLKTFLEENKPIDAMVGAALVRTEHGTAIAIELGENLSQVWRSGDVLFLWDNGEHTTVRDDDKIEILQASIWPLEETA